MTCNQSDNMWPTPVTYDATPGGPGNHYKGLGWTAKHAPQEFLMLSPQESPASQPLSLDLGPEPTTSDGSGRRLLQSYEHFVPAGSWQRTLLESLASQTATPSPRFSMKWRASATRCKRLLFEHVLSGGRINVPACSSSADLWRTPDTNSTGSNKAPMNQSRSSVAPGSEHDLRLQAAMWATGRDGKDTGQSVLDGTVPVNKLLGREAMVWTHGTPEPGREGKTARCATLNPRFALWLMGFPADWLDESPR